jgi:hypothetical protein
VPSVTGLINDFEGEMEKLVYLMGCSTTSSHLASTVQAGKNRKQAASLVPNIK